jgi:lipoic acid synthetase
VLKYVKDMYPDVLTKTGFMVGLGETEDQIDRLLDDLAEVGCDILTIGQYLQPSPQHYPLQRYVTPEEFAHYKEMALNKGFRFVTSTPLVRSSYRAAEAVEAVAAVAESRVS